jgi:hypothetical protein
MRYSDKITGLLHIKIILPEKREKPLFVRPVIEDFGGFLPYFST